MLRPGNAGANNTNDHLELLDAAIDTLPEHYRRGHMIGDTPADVHVPMLVRADSAGRSHGFIRAIVEANADYSIGHQIDGRIRDGLLLVQEDDWRPAANTDGNRRHGAEVHELTSLVEADRMGTGVSDHLSPGTASSRRSTLTVRHQQRVASHRVHHQHPR